MKRTNTVTSLTTIVEWHILPAQRPTQKSTMKQNLSLAKRQYEHGLGSTSPAPCDPPTKYSGK